MNILKKIVAVLLTVCLLFGMVPMSVSATETDTKVATTSTEDSDDYRILHLDCGRKYFTKDWIIALINEMTSAGYTHLELAFGNDGLRFLLDDMSVTANGTTYSSANVTAVIHAGNEAYYDAGDVDELTQNEMDAIIAYANSVGIEIIPLLNTPGHMDTIITAMTKLGFDSPQYSSSARTVDVADTKAVAFTQALVFKYMDYFAGKGCKNFNIGADEYANDTGNPQFSALITYGLYDEYITYLNTLAEYAVNKGMTPMAFNDGIYYNQNTSNGTINENIMVCYWSSGWSSYNVASASYLANKGFEMINTHGDYYFVLTSNGITNPSSTALNFDNETFMNSTIKNPAGSMFCIWCDAPGIATETEVAAAVRITLRKMAAAMNDTTTYSEEVVVGGFNADGTINTGSGSDDDETSELVTLTKNEVTVTAYDLIGLNVTEATAPTIAGAKNVLAWDMIPFTDDGNYTGSATVSVPVPTGWNTADMGAFVVNDDGTVELLKGTYSNGNYAFTMPHFSVGGIYDVDATADDEMTATKDIELVVGESKTVIDSTGNYEEEYNKGNLNTNIATVGVKGIAGSSEGTIGEAVTSITAGKYVIYTYLGAYVTNSASGSYIGLSTTDETVWNVAVADATAGTYYITDSDGNYLSVGNGIAGVTTTQTAVKLVYGTSTDGPAQSGFFIQDAAGNYNLNNSGNISNAYGKSGAAGSWSRWQFKPYTETSVVDSTEITFTGISVGETSVTVGNTIYNITVSEVVLSDVEPLKIEYWITNGVVEDPDTNLNYIEISAEDAYSENGIVLSDTLPEELQREGRDTEYWQAKLLDVTVTNDSTSGTEEQTRYKGDDETLNTKTFTRVRYWNNEWQVLVGTEWTIVDRTEVTVNTYNNDALTGTTTREKNQLVAYYMEVININNANGTTELHVNAADWGFKSGENWGYWTGGYTPCTVTVQIVYEDGTTNPSDAFDDLLTKTLVYGYWTGGRGLGTMIFDGGDAYDIYKVTAETGDAGYTNNLYGFTINSLTWDGNEETVWSDDPSQSVSIGNPASNPSYEEPKDNLTWNTGEYNKNNAILVRVYVKAVETEDTLTVVYYDEKFGDTLYSYNINVKSDVTFNDSIVNLATDNVEQPAYFVDADGNTTSRYNVTGYGIHNALDVIQKFQTDLTQVPEAVGKYNSALYSYTGSEISEDGKTLYLYYNINTSVLKPNFVVDFGLPITFNLSDVTNTPDLVKTVTASARYGTVSYDSSEKTFTYTPTQILQNIDVLSINILFDGATAATTTNVGVTPATTVYYEESFLTWDSNWYGGNAAIIVGNQTKEVLGEKKNNFGYDPVYANTTAASNGTNASTSIIGATATFTFTGDGIQVFANSTESTGYVAVQVKNSSGAIVNMAMVDTVVDKGTTGATSGQTDNMYGLPIVSLIDLKNMPHDTYTVTITKIMDNKPVYIDGIRVFNTMEDSTIFAGDLEDNPDFYELRDMVLYAIGVQEDTSVDYKTMYEQVYDAVEGATALITDESVTYGNSNTIQDLLDNGPKNEVYLYADQTLTFKVTTNRVMQIGMKAPQGATTASISVDGGTTTTSQSIDSSVDMFYTLADKAKNETKTTYTVQIENTGSDILSITELKICDDPNATFVPFTEDEIKNIMCGKPEETEDQPAKEEDKEVTPDKPAVTFKDIKEGSFYYDSVYWAVRKDITQGIGDSLFNPEGTCTRAQVVTFLWRAAGEPKPETTKNPFVDVEEGAYYYDAVLWAYENGITLGLDEEHFDPEGACTRAQVVTFLWRVAEKPKAETAKNPFEDVKKDDYYYDAVLWAYKNGITNGISDTQFQIDGTCKRAQAVTFLYRMYE